MASREDKKTRILEAAEKAYAQEGSNFSLRTVTKLANVNVAAVNYYFQSKSNLLELMAERILGGLNTKQLISLEDLKSKKTLLTVEEVVTAFVTPFFTFNLENDNQNTTRSKMLGVLLTDTNTEIREIFYKKTKEVDEAYISALQQALPSLPLAELTWRYRNMIGLIVNNVGELLPLTELDSLELNNKNYVLMQWIINYSTAAFHAPVTTT